MNAARDLHHLLDRALGDDPLDSLLATRVLADEVTGWVTERAVLNSRRSGKSWAKIARVLTISRQAAHRRFAHLDRIVSIADLPRRPKATGPAEDTTRTAERLLNQIAARRLRTPWEADGRGNGQDEGDVVPW